jgi:Hydantoinase/oxoprolinase N-terminal region
VERITKGGSVLAALDQEQARISLLALLEQEIEAVTVALLRLFKNPAHERRVRELIRSNDLGQSLSVQRVCPRSPVQSKPDLTAQMLHTLRRFTVADDSAAGGVDVGSALV